MKVIILTEGGKKSGLGHICRCVSLYQAFQKRGVKAKLIISAENPLRCIPERTDYELFDWIKNEDKALSLLEGFDTAVIDSYLCSSNFYNKVSSALPLAVFFDDNKRLDYPAGVVCNGNIYARELMYPRKKGVKYLLGPRFALLRKEFWLAGKKRIRKNASSLFITLGGSDTGGLLRRIIVSLRKSHPQLRITALPGGSADAKRMKQLMLGADIAVSGCGQTLSELARTGVPTIGILLADNQSRNISGWRRAGFLAYAGKAHSKRLERVLSERLDMLLPYSARKRMSSNGQAIIDGKGSLRLADNILKIAGSLRRKAVVIRRARISDCRDLWKWRNHPEVRKRCFDQRPIRYETHREWFFRKLKDGDTSMFIAESSLLGKIGQVRFEKGRSGRADININLNPEFMGEGFGRRIITLATGRFLSAEPDVKAVRAVVLQDNAASKKVFSSAGYKLSRAALNYKGARIFRIKR